MLKIEKMKSEKLKTFQKLLTRISSSIILSTITAGRTRAEEEMFSWKLIKPRTEGLDISGNTVTIFHVLHNKVALLVGRSYERRTRNCHQNFFKKVWNI